MSVRLIATRGGWCNGLRQRGEEFDYEGDPNKFPRWAVPADSAGEVNRALHNGERIPLQPSAKSAPERVKPTDYDPQRATYQRMKARGGNQSPAGDTKPLATRAAVRDKIAGMRREAR